MHQRDFDASGSLDTVFPLLPRRIRSVIVQNPVGLNDNAPNGISVLLAPLHSLIHSGLSHAARACRKTFNLKGRNFRFEYTAKTGICGEAHFGSSRTSAPLASASTQ